MSEKLPYASLPALEQAAREQRQVAFVFHGTAYKAEPHAILAAPRTKAIIARMWIDGMGWRDVGYADIRSFEVDGVVFRKREMPTGRILRLA